MGDIGNDWKRRGGNMTSSPPFFYPRLIDPPKPESYKTPDEYRKAYDEWARTGGYNSYIGDLTGLTASVDELNTLVGINPNPPAYGTVRQQLDAKFDVASAGTMAVQNANNVAITGGTIDSVDISGDTITGSTISGCTINNSINIPVGITGLVAVGNGVLTIDNTIVYYSGTGQSNLMSYELLPNILGSDKAFIEYSAWGEFATNANSKILRVQFGATQLFTSGPIAANGGSWFIEGKILRNGLLSEQSILSISSSNAAVTQGSSYLDVTENSGAAQILKLTAEGSATGDIYQKGLIIKWSSGV